MHSPFDYMCSALRHLPRLMLLVLTVSLITPAWSADEPQLAEIRVASLKFGTLNWELDTMSHQRFDRQAGFRLQPLALASVSATRTALLSGSADVIVADWLWVSHQRDRGIKLQFIPYSAAIAKVMVAPDSDIHTLADLRGKKIGIAGGPVDKGWLLLQAQALQQGLNLKQESQQQYAAPPLLNAALKQGQLDAVLTYWHYAARLRGQGYRQLLDLRQTAQQLGLANDLPMLGLVFHQDWAEQQPQLVRALAQASRQTKTHLRTHPEAWQRLKPMMRIQQQSEFEQLRRGFIDGIPKPLSPEQRQEAARMFALLARLGGRQLVGESRHLDPLSFWIDPAQSH